MSYVLAIGDYAYSSWSLRAWLLFNRFGIPVTYDQTPLYRPEFEELLARFPPARTVPALRLPDGTVVTESLAIAEELASRHPDAGFWPDDPSRRAQARMLAAEMHAGFRALRDACPMNLRVSYQAREVAPAVQRDLDRLAEIWALARRGASGGPWLFGDYSIADAFFAPVAARIAGYALPLPDDAMDYVNAHLSDPAFRRWRATGLVVGPDQAVYARDWPTRPWPRPTLRRGERADGPSVNAGCPFSGKPVTHFMRVDDTVIGFCNPTCRDKAAADPEAWPAVAALLPPASS